MSFATSMGYDETTAIARRTIDQVQKLAEKPLSTMVAIRRTAINASQLGMKVFARASARMLAPVLFTAARKYADWAIPGLQQRAEELLTHAMVLERSQELLIEEMVLTGVCHDDDLPAAVDKLLEANALRIAQYEKLAGELRSFHAASRLGAAYARLAAATTRVSQAADSIKAVCLPGEHALAVFSKVHSLQAQIDAGIASYMEDEEFDPELMALADQALDRISQDSKLIERL